MNPEWMANITVPNPETLVDRLNGIYPSAIGPYKASPLEKEAANEIVVLRKIVDCFREGREPEYAIYSRWARGQIKNAPKGAS